jgi:CubicO group peptidase (beta-lactamase class C family)/alpha-beta hydrolase superfamily lysophospholipase
MRSARSALIIAACSGAFAGRSLQAQRSPDMAALDRYVAAAARDWHVPGLAIAVVRNDSLVFAKGYGVLEMGKAAPATEHTRFAIGSTTKAMTAVALAMLVDEGKLRWDDRVIDYVPDFRLYDPYATRELTIRDLLTHRSGLPATDMLWAIPENEYTQPEMIRRLRFVQPSSSFRSQWEYQNVVYAIGGFIVERVSGMPWATFVENRIFAPLGMTETVPLVSRLAGKPNVATPHAEIHDTLRVVPIRSTDAVAAAGSVWSSVSDMSKWMRFMLDSGRVGDKRLISTAAFSEIIAPQMRAPMQEYPALSLARPKFLSYAFGWFVQDYHGHTVWMHTGSIDGMSAIIGLLPEERVGVYVLENLDHAELRHALMYKVFDLYTGASARDWSADLKTLFASRRAAGQAAAQHVTGTQPSLPLDKYVGSYGDSTYGPFDVTSTNGVLHARFGKADFGDLDHWEYDSFRTRENTARPQPITLTFAPDGSGNVRSVRTFGITFMRSPPPPRRVAEKPDYSAPSDAPYTATDVTVTTPTGFTLAGTLTLPKKANRQRRVGAVVTVTGSGPEDRDEYIGIESYRPFRQFADSLGRRGIAVLRMDDRGTGASKGPYKGATSADFAEDIRAGLAYLRTRPEIDPSRLAVLGHSEGALIAPLVAEKEPDLRAIVLLAGIARPGRGTLEAQLKNLANHNVKLTQTQKDSAIRAIPARIDSLAAADPWMAYFLKYDPSGTARHLSKPSVLILTGANDQQADPTQVPEWAAAFHEAGNRDVTAEVLPGLNHLFVTDPDGFPGGYTKLPPPVRVDSHVLGLVADWLAQRLK